MVSNCWIKHAEYGLVNSTQVILMDLIWVCSEREKVTEKCGLSEPYVNNMDTCEIFKTAHV